MTTTLGYTGATVVGHGPRQDTGLGNAFSGRPLRHGADKAQLLGTFDSDGQMYGIVLHAVDLVSSGHVHVFE